MGANSSTPENPSPQNPSSSSTMSSKSPEIQNPDPKTPDNHNPDPKTPENQSPEVSNQPISPDETGQINKEEREKTEKQQGDGEEEGECGFCLFMKGGGCKDSFIDWENCVEEAEKNNEDIVEKCFQVTSNLKKCMEAHSEYYEPILRAEKAAEEEVKQEMEREAESNSKAVEEVVEIQVNKEG